MGEFHATFAHDSATRLGYDYVMLGARGDGKVVGVSFTEDGPLNRFLTDFMEGDERIYIDRSNTPQIYGTGTEDFFDGGYYYFPNGPFTLPSHGLTDKENAPAGGRTAQYRLLLEDPWPFRDGIRVGIEHGAGDGMRTAARSVVFWYEILTGQGQQVKRDEPQVTRRDVAAKDSPADDREILDRTPVALADRDQLTVENRPRRRIPKRREQPAQPPVRLAP